MFHNSFRACEGAAEKRAEGRTTRLLQVERAEEILQLDGGRLRRIGTVDAVSLDAGVTPCTSAEELSAPVVSVLALADGRQAIVTGRKRSAR